MLLYAGGYPKGLRSSLSPVGWLVKPVQGRVVSEEVLRVQEPCESRGGRPGLSVLMSLSVSVDVKQH